MSYTEDFDLEPAPPSGFFAFLYLYVKGIFNWAWNVVPPPLRAAFAPYIYPYRLSSCLENGKCDAFALEQNLIWRVFPLKFHTLTSKEILAELKNEFETGDESRLLNMIANLKKYQELGVSLEKIRAMSVTRDEEYRKVLENIYSQILSISIIVGSSKEEDRVVNSKTAVDWTALGFQGTDPLTDFRGGGLLSLQQLAFFAENYTAQVRAINSRANHPKKGYCWAITGINITVMLLKAFKAGVLKKYLYRRHVTLEEFHQIFCHCFIYFDKLWTAEDPEDFMKFSSIFEKFRQDFVQFMKKGEAMSFK